MGSNGRENSSGNATTPSVPSFLASNSSEGSDKEKPDDTSTSSGQKAPEIIYNVTKAYSNGREDSNASTSSVPSFLPSNGPSDSSEGSDKEEADDASDENSDSGEDSSP